MKKFVVLLTLLIVAYGCDEDGAYGDSNDPYSEQEPEGTDSETSENLVRLRTDSTFGAILTDTEGNTLYFFSKDTKQVSNCNGGCAGAWPAFYAENLTLDDGLEANDFGTIDREGGEKQTTYKGWPLYTFASDTTPGEVNGDGSGDVWYVAKPDYAIMIANAQLVGRGQDGVEVELNSSFEPGQEDTFYITDDRGNTLYRFSDDANNTNTFTAADFSNNDIWPIFDTNIQQVPSLLNADDFGTTTVFGETQLTYKGWPVYTFGPDAERGDTFGSGAPQPGVFPTINQFTETSPEPETLKNAVRLLEDDALGKVMTNEEGYALYFFARDVNGWSNCTEGCLENWPAFYAEDLTLDEGLDADYFGYITREDGSKQTTYKGWPLYLYVQDTAAGEINGDGAGNVWFAAKPDYSLMIAYEQLVGRDSHGMETNLTDAYEPGDGFTYYITDSWGNTLYRFSNDEKDTNNFTADDFSNNDAFPIYYTKIDYVPSILTVTDFGRIEVYGEVQSTYRGWPLYKFGQDEKRGDNYGVGFPQAGAWPIVNQHTEAAPTAGGSGY